MQLTPFYNKFIFLVNENNKYILELKEKFSIESDMPILIKNISFAV